MMLRAEWERAAATVAITLTASVTDLKARLRPTVRPRSLVELNIPLICLSRCIPLHLNREDFY